LGADRVLGIRYSGQGVPVASYLDTAKLNERVSHSGKSDRYRAWKVDREPMVLPGATLSREPHGRRCLRGSWR